MMISRIIHDCTKKERWRISQLFSFYSSSSFSSNSRRRVFSTNQYHQHPTTTTTTTTTTSPTVGVSSSSSSSPSSLSSLSIFHPTDEHVQLRSTLRTFVQRHVEPQAFEYNKNESFNKKLFTQLGNNNNNLGILGITIPPCYGGSDFYSSYPITAACIVHEELSYSDPAFCLSYLAHSILLVHNLYINSISEIQKLYFLPTLCTGQSIGGLGMSEVYGGTDVLGTMKTYATYHTTTTTEKEKDDDDDHHWILNGSKMWITNGVLLVMDDDDDNHNEKKKKKRMTTGHVFLVYAKTGPQKTDVTQFLVEKDMPGFTVGQQIHNKLGMRASPTAELVFDHVILPSSTHVVGHVHQGLTCMMRNLQLERLSLAAMAIGIARRCIDEMIRYTKQRQAFGSPIIEYGQIQKNIAESYAEYMAAKCYVYSLAYSMNNNNNIQQEKNNNNIHHGGGNNTLDADGVKLFAAQMAKKVADRAIQCLGGYGYVGEYVVERMWRDAKLLEIGGGTNESHHKNMIRILKKRNDKLD